MLIRYIRNLNTGRLILWCYLCWYLVVLIRYFDPNPRIWLTSVGLSGIIGIALVISATNSAAGKTRLDRWQTFRLFLMPFCVSSFAALIKDRGFILIFSPKWQENAAALGLVALMCAGVLIVKRGR